MHDLSDTDAKQPGQAAKAAKHTRVSIDQQLDQIIALIRSSELTIEATRLTITVNVQGKKRVQPLKAKRDSIPYARLYIASLYQDTHKRKMLVSSYNQAVTRLTLEAATQDTSTPAHQPDKLAEIQAMLVKHGTMLEARDINATYALVKSPVEIMGIWRLAGSKTCRLTDCYVEVVRLEVPSPTSTSHEYAVTLSLTNTRNQQKTVRVTRQDIDANNLYSHFKGYGNVPETPLQKQFLLEALNALMQLPGVIQQLQTDSLGWVTLDTGSLVWVMANGVETLDGFTPAATAPYIAPTCLSPGYGYYGTDQGIPDDSAMQRLLIDLLPLGQTLTAALLGLSARVQLHIPDDSTPGMLRFTSELIGPTRHGKSRLVNAVLSMFGTKFEHNKGTLLNMYGGKDSNLGRLLLTALMRYHLFADFDHKASPGDVMFDQIHKTRAETIDIYGSDTGAGSVSTQRGSLRTRAKPAGALIRTSNYDHAEYSLNQHAENIETRVCSFVWPIDATSDSGYQRADDQVSHDLERQRLALYAYGRAYRQWIMRLHQAGTLASLIASTTSIARDLVNDATWLCDLHRNQAVDIVLGLLMFQEFIESEYPSSFLAAWINDQLLPVITSRSTRCASIHTQAKQHSDTNRLTTFVASTIRTLLTSQHGFITSQQGLLLQPTDTPHALDQLGYRRTNNASTLGSYSPGQLEVGHLVTKLQALALNSTLVYDTLTSEATRAKLQLPAKHDLLKLLVDAGMALPDVPGNKTEKPVKIKGKTGRYLVMPLDVIYPAAIDISPDVDTSDSDMEVPDNITPLPSPVASPTSLELETSLLTSF